VCFGKKCAGSAGVEQFLQRIPLRILEASISDADMEEEGPEEALGGFPYPLSGAAGFGF
jgi:hypothetical protein